MKLVFWVFGIQYSAARIKCQYLQAFELMVDTEDMSLVELYLGVVPRGGRRGRQSVFIIKWKFAMEKTDEHFLSDYSWQLWSDTRGAWVCFYVHLCLNESLRLLFCVFRKEMVTQFVFTPGPPTLLPMCSALISLWFTFDWTELVML